MPDTTNLLDAHGLAVFEYFYKLQLKHDTWDAYTALRDEIVRQAREGMVDGELHFSRVMEVAKERDEAESENARLRAELETAKRGEQKAWVEGVRWMCEKFSELPQSVRAAFDPASGDAVFYCGERIENIAATKYPAPAVADTGEREAACDQCGQPLREGDARDFDHKTTRHTIRGCIRALGVAMGGGK